MFMSSYIFLNATEGNLDAFIFNPVTSTIPIWRTLKLLWRMQSFDNLTRNNGILCADRSQKAELLLIGLFLGGSELKYKHGAVEC
jgi:hypothetical protein